MNQNLIYFPCFAMLILSGLVLLRVFATRVKAVRSGTVDLRFFKTYDQSTSGPVLMTQAARNFTNLFEVPTLFYMVCLFALLTKNVDHNILTAAWLYVILRYLHSFIHVTSNKIGPRMGVYGFTWVILLYIAIVLAYRISTGA